MKQRKLKKDNSYFTPGMNYRTIFHVRKIFLCMVSQFRVVSYPSGSPRAVAAPAGDEARGRNDISRPCPSPTPHGACIRLHGELGYLCAT